MVFIGGLQRSGTTLLSRLLAAHPDAAGLVGTGSKEDEGQFVQDVYLDDHTMGRPDGGRSGRVNHWAYHPRAHLTELDAREIPRAAHRLLSSWAPFWSDPDAKVLVEKSPSNMTRTRFLQELFPGARFLVVTRHPVTQALASRKWADRRARIGLNFGQLVDHWLTAMETFDKDRQFIKQITVIRYEDLLEHPLPILNALFEFLGLKSWEIDTSIITDTDQRYRKYWRQMTSGSLSLEPLAPTAQGRAAERIVGHLVGRRTGAQLRTHYETRIARFGYSFADFG
jgi:hypothetical protein